VTQTLECAIKTLCYPPAALFVFCLALMAANSVAVLKAAVRATHGEEQADDMSDYYMALEIKQVHEGMMIALPPDEWTIFRDMSVAEFAAKLKEMAAHMDLGLYRKMIGIFGWTMSPGNSGHSFVELCDEAESPVAPKIGGFGRDPSA